MASRSYVLAVVRILDRTRSVRLTAEEVFNHIDSRRGAWLFPNLSVERGTEVISGVLEELRDLGIVFEAGGGWGLSPAVSLNRAEKAAVDDGGGGLPPLTNGNLQDGDGDGTGGVGEILSHRYLFSLDDDAFDDAIDRALTVY